MLTQLKYRTFDELLAEVSSDLHVLNNEGMIEPAQLIKIARKVNKDLGLTIHSTKETLLEIEHNKARLPDDFYVLNMALLCDRHHVRFEPLPSGTHREDVLIPWPTPILSTCPCLNVTNSSQSPVQATIINCDGSEGSITVPPGSMQICAQSVTYTGSGQQAQSQSTQGSGDSIASCNTVENDEPTPQQVTVTYFDGTVSQETVPPNSTTCFCAQSVSYTGAGAVTLTEIGPCYSNTDNWCCGTINPITVTTNGYCYNNDGVYTTTPPITNCAIPEYTRCNQDPDPMLQHSVYSVCCGNDVQVIEHRPQSREVHVYEHFEKLYIKPAVEVDTTCMNTRLRRHEYQHTGELKNDFLYTDINRGKVFISYQGMMEDREGNLLVLDHELINEYYEYALKERILENLYFNGEDVLQKLQYVQTKLKPARTQALSIVNTPNFQDLLNVWKMNRKYMYDRYYKPFMPYFV